MSALVDSSVVPADELIIAEPVSCSTLDAYVYVKLFDPVTALALTYKTCLSVAVVVRLVPEVPDVPLVPLLPDEPLEPDVPLVPEVPVLPEVPELPVWPEVPLVPDEPVVPD